MGEVSLPINKVMAFDELESSNVLLEGKIFHSHHIM
jgi:hypothetical protein